MTFFKVSFSSDSLEGLTTLAGLSRTTTSGPEAAPPPSHEHNHLNAGSIHQQVGAPPEPTSLGSQPTQVAPPPLPILEGLINGESDSKNIVPPLPETMVSIFGGEFTHTEVDPPPIPPKKHASRAKK